jgi:DNA-binding HxlR family transcriptional regulator
MAASTPRPGVPVRGSESGRPIMAALDLLGRRWVLRILWELSHSPAGFRELQRRCERMSSSVLSTRLTELTGTGLLTLHEDGYHLTPLGEDLVTALGPLTAWSRRWADET